MLNGVIEKRIITPLGFSGGGSLHGEYSQWAYAYSIESEDKRMFLPESMLVLSRMNANIIKIVIVLVL